MDLRKGVLLHPSNSMNLEDRNLLIKRHTKLKVSLSYVGATCQSSFKSIAFTNLKLRIIKVGKLDV